MELLRHAGVRFGHIGSPDGTGVIVGNNKFAGDIIANANDGTLWLLDPTANTSTLIGTNGSRGDYTGLDLNDGSLLLTQTDEVLRLSCGQGCAFTPPVPELSTWAMMIVGFCGVGLLAYRRRDRAISITSA